MKRIRYRRNNIYSYWYYAIFFLTIFIVAIIAGELTLSLIYFGLLAVLSFIYILGEGYSVEDDNLIVYTFFHGTRYPIRKITRIRYIEKQIPLLGKRTHLAVSFSDRSVLKSTSPMSISVKDSDSLVSELLNVNPDIQVIRP